MKRLFLFALLTSSMFTVLHNAAKAGEIDPAQAVIATEHLHTTSLHITGPAQGLDEQLIRRLNRMASHFGTAVHNT